jgi:hypothetical protein
MPLLASLLCVLGLSLGGGVPRTVSQHNALAAPKTGTVISGVTMAWDNTDASRLRFEVCGPDVTQIPGAGLPLTVVFNTAIHRLTSEGSQTSLVLGTHIAGQVALVSLARDPFTPPEPWRITIVIELAQTPDTGRFTIGTWPPYELTPGLAPGAEHPMVVLGDNCDEFYAVYSP